MLTIQQTHFQVFLALFVSSWVASSAVQGVPLELSGRLRWACISLMLLRAGLLIKPRTFRARLMMVLRLGALPCIKTATLYSAVLVSRTLVGNSGRGISELLV